MSKKQKNIEWVCGSGCIMNVRDMEEAHINNAVIMLVRKLHDYLRAEEEMTELGYSCVLSEPKINNVFIFEWLDIFGAELKRRQAEEVKRAKRLLEASPFADQL